MIQKSEFLEHEVTYVAHKSSANGISSDEIKIDTLAALHSSQNLKELRLVLGMITYCAKFTPKFATITDPNMLLTT